MKNQNHKEEYKKCIEDPIYFYEKYTLVNGKKPDPLSEAGREYLKALCERKYNNGLIILKSRIIR